MKFTRFRIQLKKKENTRKLGDIWCEFKIMNSKRTAKTNSK